KIIEVRPFTDVGAGSGNSRGSAAGYALSSPIARPSQARHADRWAGLPFERMNVGAVPASRARRIMASRAYSASTGSPGRFLAAAMALTGLWYGGGCHTASRRVLCAARHLPD